MITAICFVDDIGRSFAEAHRIFKPDGLIILGFVDKESPLGKFYQSLKEKSIYYKGALFYSTEEVYKYLLENNFKVINILQTVFGLLEEINEIQTPENAYWKGSFVVIKARKISD